MKAEAFEDMVSRYFDDALGVSEIGELNGLLVTRPDLASRFVEAGRIHGGLRELSLESATASSPVGRRRPQAAWAISTLAAAAFLVLVGVLARPGVRLESSTGTVRFNGSSLETPAGGAATLVLPGGTRLHAGAETVLTLAAGSVTLSRGTLAAEVLDRAATDPFLVTTPQAEVRAPGGRFLLSVELDSTLCRVEEGDLRMLRRETGEILKLRGGNYALAGALREFRSIPVSTPASRGDPIRIKIVAPERWPKSYVAYPFHAGSLLYRDRGWEITDIPPEVDGALGIATLAEDRRSQEERLLVFEIDRPADVWVGIDGRAAHLSKKLPLWLEGWESTGLRIHSKTASNSYYHLYRRRFPAGEVALGGNHQGGDTGAVVNYTVLVTPAIP